jgi:hypothetical protein
MTALMQLLGIKETTERVLGLYRTWILLAEDGQPGPWAWRLRPEQLEGTVAVSAGHGPKGLLQRRRSKQPASGPSPNHHPH